MITTGCLYAGNLVTRDHRAEKADTTTRAEPHPHLLQTLRARNTTLRQCEVPHTCCLQAISASITT